MRKPFLKNRGIAGRSVPRFYVQAIFALAAALALTTAACSKQDGAQPVPAAPAKPAAAATPASGATPAGGKSELDNGSGTGATVHKRGEDLGTTNVGRVREREPDPGAVDSEGKPLNPMVESVVYYDPSGQTPDQLFAKKANIELQGALLEEMIASDIRGANGEDLYYTGAGEDTLREQLYVLVNNYQARLDQETRDANKSLAQTIQLSSFEVDWQSRSAILQFSYMANGKKAKVTMEGAVNEVMQFEVGSLSRTPFIRADVACMDLTGGCKSVQIRVQDRREGRLRTAYMLARKTSATLFTEGNRPGLSQNPEYDRLMQILLNTVSNPRGANVVDRLTLTTSETIGGASNFAITMDMNLLNQHGRPAPDMVQITGPLVKPLMSDDLNIAAVVSPALTNIGGEIVPVEGRIAEVIRDVRLLKNNGRGNLQVELSIRKTTIDSNVDRIILSIGRIHSPTGQLRLRFD